MIRFSQISAVALWLAHFKKDNTILELIHGIWPTIATACGSFLLLSSVLFVNKVLTLFTCDNGSEKGTGVNENEHTRDPLLYIWFKIKIFSHPAILDSCDYGHQIAVPRVSAITATSFPGSSLYLEKVPWLRLVTCLLDFSRFQRCD